VRHLIQILVILASLLFSISNTSAQVSSIVLSNYQKDIDISNQLPLNVSIKDNQRYLWRGECIDYPQELDSRSVWSAKISSDTMYVIASSIYETWDSSSNAWSNNTKYTYSYDGDYHLTTLLQEEWDSSSWRNILKYTFTNDQYGYVDKELLQSWYNNYWINFEKYSFVYNSGGNKIWKLIQRWGGTDWINYWLITYDYNKNEQQIEKLEQNWNGIAWVNINRCATTYDGYNNKSEDLNQLWNGNEWIDISRNGYIYDVNKKLTEVLVQWRDDSNWVNDFKITHTYGTNDSLIESLWQRWYGDEWILNSKFIYTYDVNGYQTEGLGQMWHGSEWINLEKYTYTWQMLYSSVIVRSNVISKFSLSDNYPNPFNPSTQITYSVPKATNVTLKVYDVLGQEVALLVDEKKQPGEYNVTWNAEGVPSGVYFYRIVAGEFVETKKMVLIR
jgi:Secretion system C-terminal sorting domain